MSLNLDQIIFQSQGLNNPLLNQPATYIDAKANSFVSSVVAGFNSNKSAFLNSVNSDFGYKVQIDTLTQIRANIVEQKFYEIEPSKVVPVKVGFGAWSNQLLTYKSTKFASNFEEGDIDTANGSKIAKVDFGITPEYTKIKNWAKEGGYNLFDINQAQISGNWNLIQEIESSRKKNWDLGIQKIAFLGHSSDTDILGLLNQSVVASDTTTITKAFANMSESEFQTAIKNLLKVYFANSNSTAMPDTFVLAMSDWLGLGQTSASATYAGIGKTRREYLEDEFKKITQNPNATIVAVAYCDKANNSLAKNRYALYNKNQDVLEMNIPISYTSTIAGSYNNFQFQSIAYGQYTGVKVYRPKEIIYFDFNATI